MSCFLRKIPTRERMQSSDFSRDSGLYPPIVVAVRPACYFFHNFSPGHTTAQRRGAKTSTRQTASCPPSPYFTSTNPPLPLCLTLPTPPSQETTKGPLCESRVTRVTQRHITVLSDCHTAAPLPHGAVQPGRISGAPDLQRRPSVPNNNSQGHRTPKRKPATIMI